MTPEETKRFFVLQKKNKKTDAEEDEFADLSSSRHAEVMRMVPVPTCCEAAQKYPTISFSVEYGDGEDSHKTEGRWYVATLQELSQSRAVEDPDYYRNGLPEPKFCPYCGTALPTMKRKNPMPKTVCRVTDGGYYCSTCKERLNCCLCDPLSSAFEPVP